MKKFKGTWVPIESSYIQACSEIINRDIHNFKRHSVYSKFISPGKPLSVAMEYYKYIEKKYFYLYSFFDKFSTNDSIGDPIVHDLEGIKLSSSTLQMIKILGDIQLYFGDLNNSDIIEIGGGNGGQCKIISDLIQFNSYTIIDIKESLKIAKRSLEKLVDENIFKKILFIDINEIKLKNKYDLVISNYCISELNIEGQIFYIKEVISKCNNAYFLMNCNQTSINLFVLKLSEYCSKINISFETPAVNNKNNHQIICAK